MGSLIYQWVDFIWLPVGWFAVHKEHRVKTSLFILTCILTLRTQVELMESIDRPTGIMTLMDSPVRTRGLIVYGIIIALFLVLAHFSPRTNKIVFFTATISIYIFAFCISMMVMAL